THSRRAAREAGLRLTLAMLANDPAGVASPWQAFHRGPLYIRRTMSERTLLMIPGPIELDPEVLRAMSRPQLGHMDAEVARAFGRVLGRAREVLLAPSAQPFVVAGSGTLAMEMAVANVIDPGERAVVLNTGYFGDRMRAILQRLGARADEVRAHP